MAGGAATARDRERRAVRTLSHVLPPSAEVVYEPTDSFADVVVNGHALELKWAGEGNPRDIRRFVDRWRGAPLVVVARRMSPGAREKLTEAGIGWADETGAAEIALGAILVSRTGRAPKRPDGLKKWTPAVMAVVEALLCGTKATVSATATTTGLSTGSCTNALRFLAEQGFLEADALRGRESARRVVDADQLLDAYAAAVEHAPASPSLRVGLLGRDLASQLVEVGERWRAAGVEWAATGAAAASVLAPYLTSVSSAEAFVDADTIAGLEARAADAALRPLDGGRLMLRHFPTVAVRRLAEDHDGLRVAPWPRVYADLRLSGVRGEDAAEHLLEVVRG